MTPHQIRARRLELGLTVDEFAFALNLTEAEMFAIEAGMSELHLTSQFLDAYEQLEERVFSAYVCCP